MALDGALAIIFAIAMLVGFWKLNHYYERSGVIFAIPFSIRRERTPRFFRVTMVLNWAVFAFAALAFLALSIAILASFAFPD
jgi:hypothetical protein